MMLSSEAFALEDRDIYCGKNSSRGPPRSRKLSNRVAESAQQGRGYGNSEAIHE
jgi:hypothetical protein